MWNSQCEIIQGRLAGKLFEPSLPRLVIRDDFPEQQAHPAPWEVLDEASARGACALRSLVAWASRLAVGIVEKYGAVRITRGELAPHAGQSEGLSHSAIGRIVVKGPQSLQRYS